MSSSPGLNLFQRRWDIELIALGLLGVSRFDGFQQQLGISRKVLSERLKQLVAEGILERRQYQSRPDRSEYLLTQKGRDLHQVIDAMTAWSQQWCPGAEDG
jgi:DNA-binding HxlR family transcriptional regulator